MGRDSKRRRADDSDGATFLKLPHVVLTSPGYRLASHTARSLLIDVCQQYDGRNNGRLTAVKKYLEPLGWNSSDVITCALRELQALGLLVLTRQGGLNHPSWFAMTWRGLDRVADLDIDPRRFARGAYLQPGQLPERQSHRRRPTKATAAPTPPDGPERATNGPSGGPDEASVGPPHGPVKAVSETMPDRPAVRI